MVTEFKVRVISKGNGSVEGEALVSREPISFYGGVNPETGVVVEKGHGLEGKSVAGKILVFPRGKGSTVGSYVLYRMRKSGTAPLALLNEECETIVAVGAIISGIACVDKLPRDFFEKIRSGQKIRVDAERGLVELFS